MIDDETTGHVHRLYAGGDGIAKVAETLGISRMAVVRRLPAERRPAHRPRKAVDAAAVRALIAEGMSQRDAAAALGISRRLVANALTDA